VWQSAVLRKVAYNMDVGRFASQSGDIHGICISWFVCRVVVYEVQNTRLGDDTSGIDTGWDGWRIGRYWQVLAGWLDGYPARMD
jgi:hypothetical protein